MEKYKVGVIGGTGMVGQRFVTLMENHPWFQLTAIAASPRSAGKTYEEAVAHRWAMKTSIPEQAKSMVVLDAQADVDKIAQAGAFSEELETVDADTAFALYGLADAGLDREQLTDCAVLRSAGATCEEAAVLILDSEDAAQTTMTALDGYIQNQIDTNKDYRPEEIPKLESAWTSARENTVLLVVAEDVNAAMDAVKN